MRDMIYDMIRINERDRNRNEWKWDGRGCMNESKLFDARYETFESVVIGASLSYTQTS